MIVSKRCSRVGTIVFCAVSILLYSSCVAYNIYANGDSSETSDELDNALAFDTSYNKVIRISENKSVTTKVGKPMSSIEYDISSMYLNSDMIKPNSPNEASIKGDVKVAGSSLLLPRLRDSSFKGYMCLHKVTDKNSHQWEFLNSGDYELYTDSNGIMMYDGYYVVAMGSYYTDYKVGSTFRVTLDSGIQFDCITGDEKSDSDTDSYRMYRPKGNNRGEIIEFIIACGEKDRLCNKYHTMSSSNRELGNLSSLGFQGNVSKIEKLNDYTVSNSLYS